jgi:hypothetical protein
MDDVDPDFLLGSPDLVTPAAPWCVPLDNLELGILLLTLPWIAAEGIRRADLERRLATLGPDMPVGTIYFQRVSRAVAALEQNTTLRGTGRGRQRRFVATPEGFAALILNLRTLRSDPTLDGSEFELKRALVAMWNVVAERIVELPVELSWTPDVDRFFERVETLTVLGRPVVTDALMSRAFDVLGLVDLQRRRVRAAREAAATELARAEARASLLRQAPVAALGLSGGADPEGATRQTLDAVRSLASHAIPALRVRATLVRYDAYLVYLDELTSLYAHTLKIVDIGRLRNVLGSRLR